MSHCEPWICKSTRHYGPFRRTTLSAPCLTDVPNRLAWKMLLPRKLQRGVGWSFLVGKKIYTRQSPWVKTVHRKWGEMRHDLAWNSGKPYVQSCRPLSILWHTLLATGSHQMLFHLTSLPVYLSWNRSVPMVSRGMQIRASFSLQMLVLPPWLATVATQGLCFIALFIFRHFVSFPLWPLFFCRECLNSNANHFQPRPGGCGVDQSAAGY